MGLRLMSFASLMKECDRGQKLCVRVARVASLLRPFQLSQTVLINCASRACGSTAINFVRLSQAM